MSQDIGVKVLSLQLADCQIFTVTLSPFYLCRSGVGHSSTSHLIKDSGCPEHYIFFIQKYCAYVLGFFDIKQAVDDLIKGLNWLMLCPKK